MLLGNLKRFVYFRPVDSLPTVRYMCMLSTGCTLYVYALVQVVQCDAGLVSVYG